MQAAFDSHIEASDGVSSLLPLLGPALYARVQGILLARQSQLDNLVNNPVFSLPTWTPPPDIDPEYVQHFSTLKIPATRYSPDFPDLLLHGLGSQTLDPDLNNRISELFQPDKHRIFYNTSGAGKTRQLLEGLCRHWGIYATCTRDLDIGSRDLSLALDKENGRWSIDKGFTKELIDGASNFKTALARNREIAAKTFSVFLLARLIVLHQFASTSTTSSLSSDELKQRWLRLQLRPSVLQFSEDSRDDDIFETLFSALEEESAIAQHQFPPLIARVCMAACAILKIRESYIALDEAQGPVEQHTEAYRSEKGDVRPALRELVHVLARAMSHSTVKVTTTFIVTGTGLSQDDISEALSSGLIKAAKAENTMDTGAFEEQDAQEEYIRRYLPYSFCNSAAGRKVLERMYFWLRGRHRFTAGFIRILLRAGLRHPHAHLNRYIARTMGFHPADAEKISEEESDKATRFDLAAGPVDYSLFRSRNEDDDELASDIKEVVHAYFLTGELPGPNTIDLKHMDLVRYGFARVEVRGTSTIVKLHEPLVLLGCAAWLNDMNTARPASATYHRVAKSFDSHNPTTGRNGFEEFIALYLARAFRRDTPLDEIFEFSTKDRETLGHKKARIVALHSFGPGDVEEGTVDYYVPKDRTPIGRTREGRTKLTGTLGGRIPAGNMDDLLNWMTFQRHSTFCFPMNAMGPDIIFVLKLEGEPPTYIWVVVQCKRHSSKFLSSAVVRDALRTVTPSRFFSFKSKTSQPGAEVDMTDDSAAEAKETDNNFSASSRRRASVLKAMKALPCRAKSFGTYSVLRVICGFPAQASFAHIREQKLDATDKENHPLALLNVARMKELTKVLEPHDALARIQSWGDAVLTQKKRGTGLEVDLGQLTYDEHSTQLNRMVVPHIECHLDYYQRQQSTCGIVVPARRDCKNKEDKVALLARVLFKLTVLDVDPAPLSTTPTAPLCQSSELQPDESMEVDDPAAPSASGTPFLVDSGDGDRFRVSADASRPVKRRKVEQDTRIPERRRMADWSE